MHFYVKTKNTKYKYEKYCVRIRQNLYSFCVVIKCIDVQENHVTLVYRRFIVNHYKNILKHIFILSKSENMHL